MAEQRLQTEVTLPVIGTLFPDDPMRMCSELASAEVNGSELSIDMCASGRYIYFRMDGRQLSVSLEKMAMEAVKLLQ